MIKSGPDVGPAIVAYLAAVAAGAGALVATLVARKHLGLRFGLPFVAGLAGSIGVIVATQEYGAMGGLASGILFGIPTILVFVVLLVWTLLWLWRRRHQQPAPAATLPIVLCHVFTTSFAVAALYHAATIEHQAELSRQAPFGLLGPILALLVAARMARTLTIRP